MERLRLFPPYGRLCLPVAAALFLTGSFCLAQENSSQAQNTDSNQGNEIQGNEISALKTQMQRMQKEYEDRIQKMQRDDEDRISAMEAEMKSLESKSDSGSILNTRVLSDADGKEVEGKSPTLDESFLKSLTRNFTFSAYVRAGVQFNGNGGGGNFNFTPPDGAGTDLGRPRLGNENDTYMELTWMQAHMLGDNPDVMDVSMTFTPSIRYVQSRNTFTSSHGNAENNGNDFDFVLRQAFLEAKNVFKNAPEVTFWGGQRFYDRFNTDPLDTFWLDTSGYGFGVYNIDAGIGKLWLAYLGGLNDTLISPSTGSFYKHTFDVRLKDIDVGIGKLMGVLIGNFEKGTTFTQGFDQEGNTISLTNPLHTDSAWGIGGGLVYTINFGAGGNNNMLQLYALFGRGATNFGAGDDLSTVQGAETYYLFKHPGTAPGQTISVGNVINRAHEFRAGAQFFWSISSNLSMAIYGLWDQNNDGFFVAGTNGAGAPKVASGNRNIWEIGMRPAYWISDNIAIEGQAFGSYQDNDRTSPGTDSFGRGGSMGVFTIAPTLKPKGGYFTRPEFRVYATYAIWSSSLKGATTPAQEGGNDYMPPYTNSNHGWLFGTQVEWFF
jgi:maltoporin